MRLWRIENWSRQPVAVQREVLQDLVTSAQYTEFGLVPFLLLGHVLTEILGAVLHAAQQPAVTGWTWMAEELWLVVLALAVGLAAAVVPAWRASRTEVATVLAEG